MVNCNIPFSRTHRRGVEKNMKSYGDKLETLYEMIGDGATMMVTTIHGNKLYSRPMGLMKMEFDGTLWFFTALDTEKIDELKLDNRINASFAEKDKGSYVSIFGHCDLSRDSVKAKELWNPIARMWFDGPEDPKLVLMKVVPESAEYWDAPNSKMVRLFQMVAGAVTGKHAIDAENERLEMR